MLVVTPPCFPARVEILRGRITAFDTNAFMVSRLKSPKQSTANVELYLTETAAAFALCCHDVLSRYVATDEKLFDG